MVKSTLRKLRTAILELPARACLVGIAVVSATPLTLHASCPLVGNGTEEAPFLVSTYQDLRQVGATCGLSSVYRLTADIVASKSYVDTMRFRPIGTDVDLFRGVFHGGGHTIRDLYVLARTEPDGRPTQRLVGLFGGTSGALIDSLTLEDVRIAGDWGILVHLLPQDSTVAVGTIVGSNGADGIVRQCRATGIVEGGVHSGGIAGRNAGTIEGCRSEVRVNGRTSAGGLVGEATIGSRLLRSNWAGGLPYSYSGEVVSTSYAGGLVGWNAGEIRDCYGAGSATGARTGGLAGWNQGEIATSYATDRLAGTDFVGGLVGSNKGTVRSCYWNRQMKGGGSGISIQEGTSVSVAGLDTREMKDSARFAGFDFGAGGSWAIDQGVSAPALRGVSNLASDRFTVPCTLPGTGTALDPYQVSRYSDLREVASVCDDDGTYRVVADIDASASVTENDGSGFVPIGAQTGFTGVFHGGGHTIRGLHIRSSRNVVGLFATLSGTVDSLGLVEADIAGTSSGASIGGVVGAANGTHAISFCFVTGTVHAEGDAASSNYGYAGGIVGNGAARHCASRATVSGRGMVGGIAGQGQAVECYAAGRVVGGARAMVGGIVGSSSSQGDVQNCYSTAQVRGGDSSKVGGVVGYAGEWLRHVYATGAVQGGERANVGGLVGTHVRRFYLISCLEGRMCSGYLPAGLTDGYWDSTLTGQSRSVGVSESTTVAATALSASQMTDPARFTGFSFAPDSAWSIVAGSTRPLLRRVPGGVQSQLDGNLPSTGIVHRSTTREVHLHRDGSHLEFDLATASRVRVCDASGRSSTPPIDLAEGHHRLDLPSSRVVLFLQVAGPNSTRTFTIPPTP